MSGDEFDPYRTSLNALAELDFKTLKIDHTKSQFWKNEMRNSYTWRQVAYEVDGSGVGTLVTREVGLKKMSEDDIKPWDKVKLPTDEQVEMAARVLCAAAGQDPDLAFFKDGQRWRLAEFTKPAREHLLILLNKDKILGYGHD